MAFPVGWLSSSAIVVQHGQVTADQTAFPVLITEATFATNCPEILTTGDPHAAQSDGGDLRFSTDSLGATQIACEVVLWSQNATFASALAEVWVPRDILTASDVTIYVWWQAGGGLSQPAANASFGSQAVWDSNYKAVYHLQTIAAAIGGATPDSTATGNNLANNNGSDSTSVTAVAGKIGNAGSFAGSLYRLINTTTTGLPSGTNVRTIEGWFKRTSNTGAQEFFGYGDNSGTGKRFAVYWQNDGKLYLEAGSASANFNWTADLNWHHVAYTLPSGTTTASVLGYLDGTSQTMGNDGATLNAATANIQLSCIIGTATTGYFGLLDEVRISNIARSSSWMATGYNAQNSPGTFAIAGTRQAHGGTAGLFRVGQNLSGLGTGGPFFSNPLN